MLAKAWLAPRGRLVKTVFFAERPDVPGPVARGNEEAIGAIGAAPASPPTRFRSIAATIETTAALGSQCLTAFGISDVLGYQPRRLWLRPPSLVLSGRLWQAPAAGQRWPRT
jgi:hypothetical protein